MGRLKVGNSHYIIFSMKNKTKYFITVVKKCDIVKYDTNVVYQGDHNASVSIIIIIQFINNYKKAFTSVDTFDEKKT